MYHSGLKNSLISAFSGSKTQELTSVGGNHFQGGSFVEEKQETLREQPLPGGIRI
jgi:hypothetical protein